ncbi:MAG: tetraacyldisaccharide 4'-kinase [Alphaproteobacteria bacterium]
MRRPEFWDRPPGLAAALLAPAGALWTAGGRIRQLAARPARAAVPVVCVGNVTVGGSGKTPVALSLARRLAALRPVFLTRGHGGRLAGPVAVDLARHAARDVGDEALLLARAATTVVARDRRAGAALAAHLGASVVIMDDGLQNPGLRKDLSLLVVDGEAGFGNGLVMPAGPLREPVGDGLARADAVVIVGEDRHGLAAMLGERRPLLRARIEATEAGAVVARRRVVAFAGIGRPEKFFATLRALGCDLVAAHPFADHHVFTPDEIMRLVEAAAARDALPVTTEKDWVRLPAEAQPMVTVLPVMLRWADAAALDRVLAPLSPAAAPPPAPGPAA